MAKIATLDDLIDYCEKEAEKLPDCVDEVLLKRAGLPWPRVAAVSRVHALPEVYESVIRTLDIFGVSIGYFALWPCSSRDRDLADAILESNEDTAPPTLVARQRGLIIVGADEADLVAVGTRDSDTPDKVFRIEFCTAPGVRVSEVAPNFLVFMMLAGNLHALTVSDDATAEVAAGEMASRCQELGCSAEQAAFWILRSRHLAS